MALTEVCRTQRPRSTNRLRYSLVISRSRGQRRRWRAPVSEAPSGLLPGDCWRRAGPTSATVSNAGCVMNRSNKAVQINYSFEVIT